MQVTGSALLARYTVLLCLAGLIIGLSLDNWLQEPPSITRWLIQVVPLLLFFPSLSGKQLRPYQWLCFVILLYFIMGVLYLFTPDRILGGAAISFFCVLLFCAAIFYIHSRKPRTES